MANAGLVPTLGTPVVCHGLQKATHINGKIGDGESLIGVLVDAKSISRQEFAAGEGKTTEFAHHL